MRLETICRVCLKEGNMKSIFSTTKKFGSLRISCSDMLAACSSITVTKTDGFPRKICHRCLKKLCSAYKFRQLCEESLTLLLAHSAVDIKLEEIKTEKHDESNWESENNIGSHQSPNYMDDEKCDKTLRSENGDINNDDILDKSKTDFIGDIDSNEDMPLIDYNSETNEEENRIKTKMKKRKKLSDMNENNKKLSNQKKSKLISKTMKCNLCPKRYQFKYELDAHLDSHVGIKRYFCEICQKSYRTEKDHKKMHRRGFKFECDICSKCFNTKAKLSIHKNTHSTDREKNICGLGGCTKTFLSMSGLDRHRITHSGLKNFLCHLCSKSFIDKYQLEIHIRRHTNERPYSCSFCSKMFITASARITHERSHTNTKNYHCQYCEKSFISSAGLKRHLLCHTKEQHDACRFCGKTFARSDNRKRHEMAMHGTTNESTLND